MTNIVDGWLEDLAAERLQDHYDFWSTIDGDAIDRYYAGQWRNPDDPDSIAEQVAIFDRIASIGEVILLLPHLPEERLVAMGCHRGVVRWYPLIADAWLEDAREWRNRHPDRVVIERLRLYFAGRNPYAGLFEPPASE